MPRWDGACKLEGSGACKHCARLRRIGQAMLDAGCVLAYDAGGHGFRMCRAYKGRTYGLECGCYRKRKRLWKQARANELLAIRTKKQQEDRRKSPRES